MGRCPVVESNYYGHYVVDAILNWRIVVDRLIKIAHPI